MNSWPWWTRERWSRWKRTRTRSCSCTDAQGKEQIYKTGLWEDEALTNRLYKAGVTSVR